MAANHELLQTVLSESRLAEKNNLSQKVFRDEPILMTASQMSNYTPPVYKKMRDIANKSYLEPENVVFYKQAQFMAQHTDDYVYTGDFLRYYPTYRSMSDAQLRGYFSWRTKVRNGDIQKTSLSFAYIYLYELLNGIGVNSAEEGFLQLLHFWKEYNELDSHIGMYMQRWLKDYCIYYNLPQHFLQKIPNCLDDAQALTLLQSKTQTDQAVFDALQSLSNYRFTESRFFVLHPQDCIAVTAQVVRQLNAYYENSGNFSHRERFFGTFCEGKRTLFAGAVFYDRLHRTGYSYAVSDLEIYKSGKDQWQFSQFVLFSGKAQKTGAILRTIDSKMRLAYGFKNALKKGTLPSEWESIIDECIDNYLIKKRFESAPKIEIDLSLLGSIRSDSLITQEKLLILQEDELPIVDETPVSQEPANKTVLSDLQFRFLLCLINGTPFADLLREHNAMVSILSDEINEILFDDFGDTVIVFEDEQPIVLEDYLQDLKGYLGL